MFVESTQIENAGKPFAYAQRLRKAQRKRAARESLERAAEIFERTGDVRDEHVRPVDRLRNHRSRGPRGERARDEVVAHGVEASEVFHDGDG